MTHASDWSSAASVAAPSDGDETLFASVQRTVTSPLFSPLSDSFRDEGLGEEAHVAKGVAHSMPVSVPVFRRSPKKSSADNDDERVGRLPAHQHHTLSPSVSVTNVTVTHLYL